MTDDPIDPIEELRAQLDGLKGEIKTLADGMKASRTDPAPAVPRTGAGSDIETLAREAGISPAAIERAIGDARTAERREELEPIVRGLLEEILPEVEEDTTSEPATEAKPKPKPKTDKPPAPEPPAEGDSKPVHEHWSDKPLSNLFR